MGLREVVWVKKSTDPLQSLMGSQLQVFDRCAKSGTISQWLKHANANVSWTHIASLDFDLWSSWEESSAIHGHGSSLLCVVKKNRVQGVWPVERVMWWR